MHIAIEGCSHGELDIIYNTIKKLEQDNGLTIDLLICCGDFQSMRNEKDLKCMAVPMKYMQIQDFYKYYSGEKKAPVLTLFIGGNHEASNYLQELPYGGWVAPNIYYLGYAGVVNFGGLRIGGLSGIYKGNDYLKGHFEKSPYTPSSIRSSYHVRKLEVFRLKQLSKHLDIFLSHDWPRGIYNHGNIKNLLRYKQHFVDEVNRNVLGSIAAEDLIENLRPDYWFSGHLHVKFAALMKHKTPVEGKPSVTRFLALDKCLPRREFLQVLKIANKENTSKPYKLSYDVEWLTIVRLTNHLLSTQDRINYMPGPGSNERFCFTPSEEEIEETMVKMGGSLEILQSSFIKTAPCFNEASGLPNMNYVEQPNAVLNPQTKSICSQLGIDDPIALLLNISSSCSADSSSLNISSSSYCEYEDSANPDEIELSEENDNDDPNKLYRDKESGDFIFEVPISTCSAKENIEITSDDKKEISKGGRKSLVLSPAVNFISFDVDNSPGRLEDPKETILLNDAETNLAKDTEASLPKDTEANLTKDTGANLTKDTGANLTKDTGANLTKDTGANLLKDTVANLTKDTVANLTKDTVANLTKDTVANLPKDTGANLPKDTGANLPKDTGANLPKDTGANLTKDTEQSNAANLSSNKQNESEFSIPPSSNGSSSAVIKRESESDDGSLSTVDTKKCFNKKIKRRNESLYKSEEEED